MLPQTQSLEDGGHTDTYNEKGTFGPPVLLLRAFAPGPGVSLFLPALERHLPNYETELQAAVASVAPGLLLGATNKQEAGTLAESV